jgi:hypothetical protein
MDAVKHIYLELAVQRGRIEPGIEYVGTHTHDDAEATNQHVTMTPLLSNVLE